MRKMACATCDGVDFGHIVNRRVEACQDTLPDTCCGKTVSIGPGELVGARSRARDEVEIEMVSHRAGTEAVQARATSPVDLQDISDLLVLFVGDDIAADVHV